MVGVLIVSVSVGLPCARILLVPVLSILDSYLRSVESALDEYARQSKWPGRRFLELLRYTRLASLRREFMSMGLDSSLRVPDDHDPAYVERISSMLYALESEAAARGQYDLSAIAGQARGHLRGFMYSHRFRGVLVWLVYLSVPAVLLYGGTAFLEGKLGVIIPLTPGLSGVALSLIFAVAAPVATYVVSQVLLFLSWGLSKRTTTQVDDVFFILVSWTTGVVVGLASLFYSLWLFDTWPVSVRNAAQWLLYFFRPGPHPPKEGGPYFDFFGSTQMFALRAAVVAGVTLILILLLRNLCNRVLRQIAARTKQKHDDMAVELTRIFGTFLLVALGIGWIFMLFIGQYATGLPPTEGAGPLMPYALLVAVAGGLLGIGSRDMLENFFAGVSLQIDRPFEPGERVTLESGALCEVRSIGMRSCHFHNILENTDLYVPNTKLAQQIITNLSRPDREYRRSLKVFVTDNDKYSLVDAEGLVLLAAFSVSGVDVPTVIDEQFEKAMFRRNRRGILAEFAKLQEQYDECAGATIKLHGRVTSVGDLVKEIGRKLSISIHRINTGRKRRWDDDLGWPSHNLRDRTTKQVQVMEKLKEEADQAHKISYDFYKLAMCFYTLAASYPGLRQDLEHLSLELLRAPSVRSMHKLTEDGKSIWELELMVYTHMTEQSDEIMHHLNMLIQELLRIFGLLPRGDVSGDTKDKPEGEQGAGKQSA